MCFDNGIYHIRHDVYKIDVAYSLEIVSRYQSDPDENHWKVVRIILKYLRNTEDQWLIFGDTDLKLMRYTDFSFHSNHDDSKSMLDYIFTLNRGAIYWKSIKQYIVIDFVCELEYITASDAAKEAVWLQKFIIKLGVIPSVDGPIFLYCDSTGAIAQAKEPKSHQRTKNILCHYHLVREIID